MMLYENNSVKDLKIAYIGGGSRGWARTLMNDLKMTEGMSGTVYLYDIDRQAAINNGIIGNKIDGENWKYLEVETIGEALTGADFVVISILPGTFDEMAFDVHTPEKYGIYQSVGDTAGAGGFVRALRTIPMIREIAAAVRKYCPEAWVINYTNPMAVCVGALYREFPEIKAFGCCHEVFGTQTLLTYALKEIEGIENVSRRDITVNVVGVNHFTWFTSARYKNIDLFDTYHTFSDKFFETGYDPAGIEVNHWINNSFACKERVKFDLFRRFGYIAAAGDRHLAEFMDGSEYLSSKECVNSWMFGLTTADWRKEDYKARVAKTQRLLSGEETYKLHKTGEEGTLQMRALLGLDTLVTNVNIPNRGQIPNLPVGTIVETNAAFRADSLRPVFAGEVPASIYPLIARAAKENDAILEAGFSQDLDYAFTKFAELNMLKALSQAQKKELFQTMCRGTAKYLQCYKPGSILD